MKFSMSIPVFVPLVVCFFFTTLLWSTVSAKSYTSDIPYAQVEQQVRSMTSRYLKLERLFQEVKRNLNRSLLRTAMNVSLVQEKDTEFRIHSVEVSIDETPVYAHLYNTLENESIQLGGRQLLYEADVTEGLHVVAVKGLVKKGGKEGELITVNEKAQIQVLGDMTFFLEVNLTEFEKKPSVRFSMLGEKRGLLDIVK